MTVELPASHDRHPQAPTNPLSSQLAILYINKVFDIPIMKSFVIIHECLTTNVTQYNHLQLHPIIIIGRLYDDPAWHVAAVLAMKSKMKILLAK